MFSKEISVDSFRSWVEKADDLELEEFLQAGGYDAIYDLEQDDFFGTEGFNKRFA